MTSGHGTKSPRLSIRCLSGGSKVIPGIFARKKGEPGNEASLLYQLFSYLNSLCHTRWVLIPSGDFLQISLGRPCFGHFLLSI